MKPQIRTYQLPSVKPAFDIIFDNARKEAEATRAIMDLCLALEEARAADEHVVGYESNELMLLWNTMTHSPDDHLTMLRIWKSFRMPMMVDGCCIVYERAVEAMEAFLTG